MGKIWLGGWTQRVVVNGSKYTRRPVTSRVLQGMVLRPALFDMFVNNVRGEAVCSQGLQMGGGPVGTLNGRAAVQKDTES